MIINHYYKLNLNVMKKNIYLRKHQQERNKAEHLSLSQENFKTYLRIKPCNHIDPNKQILKILDTNRVEIYSPYYANTDSTKKYFYEEVFSDQINNSQIFKSTMITPINNALSGYNSTVFIYGMTGAGKTHTMFGNIGNITSKGLKTEEEGLVSMTIDYLFAEIQKNPEINTQITVSFYEIYNESIRDLLQDRHTSHQIMQDPIHGFIVQDLTQINLQDKNHTKDTLISGIERRSMNSTKSNLVSSRSHAILQYSIKRYIKSSNDENTLLQSKFFMIDLAGNQKTSTNQSQRFIEGVNINKSLLTLGKCLNLLAEKKNAYIPFRQSKLTRILKESLGGNSKTVMIACVSSERRYYQQTLNTLKYSSIARKIKNKGIKHNIKIIQNHQVPDHNINNHPNLHTQSQEHFKEILSQIISAIEEKSKIQRILEDLEDSRSQNENMLAENPHSIQIWSQNIHQIDETTQKLMKIYDANMQKAQAAYQKLMHMFNQKKEEKPNKYNLCQNRQIHRLQQIVFQQNKRITELQSREKRHTEEHETSVIQPTLSFQAMKIEENNLSVPVIRKQRTINNSLSKDSESQCSLPKNHKKLTINCTEQGTPKSLTRQISRQALHSITLNNSTNKEAYQQKMSKYGHQKQIKISLNTNLELKNRLGNKQDFIRKLKETEKKVKNMNSSAISSLLDEQQSNKYELNGTEMSMVRKLKFFQRENRIREKSKSTSHVTNRSSSSRHLNRR